MSAHIVLLHSKGVVNEKERNHCELRGENNKSKKMNKKEKIVRNKNKTHNKGYGFSETKYEVNKLPKSKD